MTDPFNPRTFSTFQVTKIPGWAVIVVAIIAGALGIGIFLLSASILLFLTPFVLASALYVRWRIGRALRQAEREAQATSIDAEYRVIDIRKDR